MAAWQFQRPQTRLDRDMIKVYYWANQPGDTRGMGPTGSTRPEDLPEIRPYRPATSHTHRRRSVDVSWVLAPALAVLNCR